MQSERIFAVNTAAIAHADLARLRLSSSLDPKKRARLGQFMTPAGIAQHMAAMFDPLPNSVRLLDAGAGVGALSAAFVREACHRPKPPTAIDVTAFEIDAVLLPSLEETLAACATECRASGIQFTARVIREDFIQHAATPLTSTHAEMAQYDCAILNPPYAKIRSDSPSRSALTSLGIETSNLYTAFVAIALDQLKAGGQLVAITPRSFCNGSYFTPFRRLLLRQSSLRKIHVYESRKSAFQDDNVLQENVVFHLVKSAPQPAEVLIASSEGPDDVNGSHWHVPFDEVVHPRDPHQFIRLAVSDDDVTLAQRVRALPCTLSDLELAVSTGRVVDFRAKEFLRTEPEPGTVPLIYPCHFASGRIEWPKAKSRKPNALVSNSKTAPLLVPRGTYVLTKRFSSKEQRRRLVAALYDARQFEADAVGFENHLNYFHRRGEGLPPGLARGLALYLNSTAVDDYFRQFSGHTQVNATDLRSLRYPDGEQLMRLGQRWRVELPPQDKIDESVENLL